MAQKSIDFRKTFIEKIINDPKNELNEAIIRCRAQGKLVVKNLDIRVEVKIGATSETTKLECRSIGSHKALINKKASRFSSKNTKNYTEITLTTIEQ